MSRFTRDGLRILAVLLAALAINGCSDSDNDDDVFQFGDLFVVTTSNRLISFNSDLPQQPRRILAISGLQAGENILGIDFRPSTGVLYGLSSNGRLYRINTFSGAATLASTLAPDPGDATLPFAGLSGTDFGIDFNPTGPVALRIVSNTGQNLRVVNPDTGLTFTDDNLNGAAASAAAAAYTNSIPAASSTTLYVIDAASDTLHIQNPPSNGTLAALGGLGVNTTGVTGFEIDGRNGRALAALNVGASSQLYSVNLANGLATLIGPIGGGETIRGLTLAPPAVTVFGVTDTNTLVRFAPGTPQTVATVGTITGLQAAETVQGIDFRPADGDLYALGSSGRVYRLNAGTGGVVASRALAADPADATAPFAALSGTAFGVDFNPVPDRLRIVSDQEQNLRLNVDTAQGVTTDENLTPLGNVVAAAYTSNFAGATSTALYAIDSNSDSLVRIGADPAVGGACPGATGNPNCGVVTVVGSLGGGLDTSALAGFDIAGGHNGLALAALRVGGSSNLYSVNLASGAATQVGTMPIGGGAPLDIRGIAIRVE